MTSAPVAERRSIRLPGLTWVAVISMLEAISFMLRLGPPVQPLLSVIFVITCPGFLLLDVARPADKTARLILGIASSMSVNVLIVTVALVGDRRWVVPGAALALVGLAFMPREQLRAVVARLGSVGRVAGRLGRPAPPALPAPRGEPAAGALHQPEPVGVDAKVEARLQPATDLIAGGPPPRSAPPATDIEEARTAAEADDAVPETATPLPAQPTTHDADDTTTPPPTEPDTLETVEPVARTEEELLAVRGIGAAKLAAIGTGLTLKPPIPGDTPPASDDETPPAVPDVAVPSEANPTDDVSPRSAVPLNTATELELVTVRGIGPAIAAAIVAHRTGNGPFTDFDELLAVPGIGPAKLAIIREAATIGVTAPHPNRPGTEGSS